ncbi:MAG: cbb3-type cytochrome c oxidase subunit 3 [Gemmatimonadota bacterium]
MGGWMMGVMTAAFLVFFVGWTLWAYNPSRKDDMDRASLMPFDDGDPS